MKKGWNPNEDSNLFYDQSQATVAHQTVIQKGNNIFQLLYRKYLASIYCVSEKAIKQKLFLYKDKAGIKNEKFSPRSYKENF